MIGRTPKATSSADRRSKAPERRVSGRAQDDVELHDGQPRRYAYGMVAELTVRSATFEDGAPIPASAAHSAVGGQNKSPQLSWTGVPEAAKSLALSCWDSDAPTTVGFTHWLRVNMPPSLGELAQGAGTGKGEWLDGITDWGENAYGGMAPPQGDAPHHYVFTVYALDAEAKELGLDQHTTYAKFRFLVRGHVLASGSTTGTFAVG
jgi:Raf kinase inhibitor-like YbhB/YbcL family protein